MDYLEKSGPSRAQMRAAPCRPQERHRHRHALQHRSAVLDRVRGFRRVRTSSRYAWGDDYHTVADASPRRAGGLDAREHPSHSKRHLTSTPGPFRSASSRSMRESAGLARTAASSIPNSALSFFSSEIICSLPLGRTAPAFDQCGTCTLCIEACPTQALVAQGFSTPAVHLVSHHRTARPIYPIELKFGRRHACLRLRRVSGGVPVQCRRARQPRPAWLPRRLGSAARWTSSCKCRTRTAVALWRQRDDARPQGGPAPEHRGGCRECRNARKIGR